MRAVRALVGVAMTVVIAWDPASASATTKQRIVASFYPLAYAAQRVGGSRVTVANLTPAGAEPHDLELTPPQIDKVLDADLVLELGHDFQPAVEKSAAQRDGPTLELLDRVGIHVGAKKVKEGDPNSLDPHVWLDPVLMRSIVTRVARALTKLDPKGRDTYRARADSFRTELADLDARYRSGLAHCERRLIVTSHEAFGYLARRYGLRQEGVAGISPDTEPDPKRIADLADLSKREHVTVIFTEELVSPRIAETLAREVGVDTDVLNPLEGLTKSEQQRGENYVTVMDANLQKLRRALGCT